MASLLQYGSSKFVKKRNLECEESEYVSEMSRGQTLNKWLKNRLFFKSNNISKIK